jgi:7,8-dihydropterin-6-yl-methyl-4-(beta-D-ribofuranosyl)aminobenzene 5'-phosphate synthase
MLLYSLYGLLGMAALTTVFFTVRGAIVAAQVERQKQVLPDSVPNLETTSRLEILPLYEEARADEGFDFGHGVSYLIRTDSGTILMDLGHNPNASARLPSLQNMRALGIAREEIDAIVISHPHPDHVGGVQAWQEGTLSFGDFTGDLSRVPIYVPTSLAYPGGTLIESSVPTLVSKDIATLGAIPYPEVFPISLFSAKGYEQGVVIHVAGQGLVLITGCGHPTMETLVTRAETLYRVPVVGVVGGLHYEKLTAEEVQPHIEFLEPRQPKLIALSPHDSSPQALEAFQTSFSEAHQILQVGGIIRFPWSADLDPN